ncbi:MAG: DNA-directed RNA polymerase subunit alpha C-terminal domain-containing protein [Lachnospirales bacterium]
MKRDIAQKSITDLPISSRSKNALKEANHNTYEDLSKLTYMEIYQMKNIGDKSLREILDCIDNLKVKYPSLFNESKKLFINNKDEICIDISIKNIKMSINTYNSLKENNILYFSDILTFETQNLKKNSTLGTRVINEIEYIKNNTDFTLYSSNILISNFTEKVCVELAREITKYIDISKLSFYKQKTKTLGKFISNIKKNSYVDKYDFLNSDEFNEFLYKSVYLQNIFENYLLNIIYNQPYGLTTSDILNIMPKYFNSYAYINFILNNLCRENRLELLEENRYIIYSPPIKTVAPNFLNTKKLNILESRLKGQTLETVGKNLGLTRERIRQIEKDIFKYFDKNKLKFREDLYREIYDNYNIFSEDFKLVFGSNTTYNYLYIRKVKNNPNKRPLNDILNDHTIPKSVKTTLEKAIYKNYVKIDKKYIPCTKNDLSNYVLRNYTKDSVTFKEFVNIYCDLLKTSGLSNNEKLTPLDRSYENKLSASPYALWKYGKRFRYYDTTLYDFSDFLSTLNLNSNQYQNTKYSTNKFFKMYPELMKEYDIVDEYELHNLLKKICTKEEYPTLSFARMPSIEFGTPDIDKQVLDLLIKLAPITKYNFAKAYQEEFGVSYKTVLSNCLDTIDVYFYDDYYKVDFPELSEEFEKKLQGLLVKDFYFFYEVEKIFLEAFSQSSQKYLNTYTMKSIGFKVYSNYIISEKYPTAFDFFNNYILKYDYFETLTFPKEITTIVSYVSCINKLKLDYEVIEYFPKKYINIETLTKKYNIDKNDIKTYVNYVYNNVSNDYFTVYSLLKSGFHHRLHKFDFPDWFFTSILIEARDLFSYLRVGGNKVLVKGKKNIKLDELLEFFLEQNKIKCIDVFDLIKEVSLQYSISINSSRIYTISENTNLFYDSINNNIYKDYETYMETLQN